MTKTFDPETGEILEVVPKGQLLSRIRLARLQWKSRYNKDPSRVLMKAETFQLLPIENRANRTLLDMKIEIVDELPTSVIGDDEFVLMEFSK